jgi:hypothetical protein
LFNLAGPWDTNGICRFVFIGVHRVARNAGFASEKEPPDFWRFFLAKLRLLIKKYAKLNQDELSACDH